MFQISSGEGTPEVLQDRSTCFPSISFTLDGLNVAMGTSTYKQGWEAEEAEEEGAKVDRKGKEANFGFMANSCIFS